ncbi:hypothetical protein HD806DRAFT_496506 [Xylariaceae sp. AK1471]|nr:hypothetical protein HD806DRAFT_496506 [Xylariaceae sp. AK1471]
MVRTMRLRTTSLIQPCLLVRLSRLGIVLYCECASPSCGVMIMTHQVCSCVSVKHIVLHRTHLYKLSLGCLRTITT